MLKRLFAVLIFIFCVISNARAIGSNDIIVIEDFLSKSQVEQMVDPVEFAKDSDYDLSKEFNIIVLRKKFTSAYDVPNVTIGEMEISLNGIAKILKSLQYENDYEKGLTSFGSATKIVLRDPIGMEKLEKGVSIQDLSEISRKKIKSLCLWNYLTRPLESLTGSEGIWNPVKNISDFSFQIREKSVFLRMVDTDHSIDFSNELRTDITSKTESVKYFERFEAEKSVQSISLRELVERLSTKDIKCEVESSLEEKTVTIIGDFERNPPARLLRSVAQIYGLTIKDLQKKDGSQILRLTTRPIRLPKTYLDAADCILEALPASLYRSCIRIERNSSSKIDSELRKDSVDPINSKKRISENSTSPSDFLSVLQSRDQYAAINSSRGRFIAEVCGSYISISLQKECKNLGKSEINKSISELSDRQKQWFVMNWFGGYVDDIRGAYSQPPKYLLKFDDLIVRCKQIGEDRGSIELGYPGETVLTGPASFFQSIVPDR